MIPKESPAHPEHPDYLGADLTCPGCRSGAVSNSEHLCARSMRRTLEELREKPNAPDDVTAVATLLKALAASGVIDRTNSVRVGNVEVHLGPADLPAAIAAMDPSDPKAKIARMVHSLGLRDER